MWLRPFYYYVKPNKGVQETPAIWYSYYQTGVSNQNTSLSYLADYWKLKTIYGRYYKIIFKSFTLFSQKQKASKTLRTQLSSMVSFLNSAQSTLGDECNMILCYSIFLYISYLQENKTVSGDCAQIKLSVVIAPKLIKPMMVADKHYTFF